MKSMIGITLCVVIVAVNSALGGDGENKLTPDKAELARVFAKALGSDENSVGIFSRPELSDVDYWHGGMHADEVAEMFQKGYYPLLLRESLKGEPPQTIYRNIVMVQCGRESDKPFFVFPGVRMALVLRRLPPGGQGKDYLVFPTSASENSRELYMAEEGYGGVACVDWPEKSPTGRPLPEMPAWYVRLSADEMEDYRRCGEWAAEKRGASPTPLPTTPWGAELLEWLAAKGNSAETVADGQERTGKDQ